MSGATTIVDGSTVIITTAATGPRGARGLPGGGGGGGGSVETVNGIAPDGDGDVDLGLAAVATAGTYTSLTGKPSLGTAAAADATAFATSAQGTKADTAVQPATLSTGLAGKADVVHTHAVSDVTGLQSALDAKLDDTQKGATNGLAELDSGGKVPASQLPSYVDDIVEYANVGAFPVTGASGVLYVALDTNLIYRWTGSTYVAVGDGTGGGLVLGETNTTAYRGDRGKAAYDHSQITAGNPHGVDGTMVSLPGVGGSTVQQAILDTLTYVGTVDASVSTKQTIDPELTAIAGLTSAADRLPYFTGSGTASLATFTAAGRALVDDADAAAQRTTLGLAIGTNVQAYDAALASLAGLTLPADRFPYTTGTDTFAAGTITAAGRAILDDADAAAQRTTLGIVAASDTAAGLVELNTNAEGITGTDTTRAMTAAAVHAVLTDANTLADALLSIVLDNADPPPADGVWLRRPA